MIARDHSAESDAPQDLRAPPEAYEALERIFGFEAFRDGQEGIVAAALSGRDVICVMPTGAGKSLGFQLPGVLLPGVTLVVSPLISLMQDQVASLVKRGVAAAAINSSLMPAEQDAVLDRALAGDLKLLYIAPERFRNERFRRRIQDMRVSLFAVDEAHCISQWGHDFRPDYRRLATAIDTLGRPPVLALTATAPPEVQEDVAAQLGLEDPVRLIHGLVRENLAYEVIRCRGRDSKDRRVLEHAAREGASLIYAATRKSVERVFALLRAAGRDVLRYHAGLSDDERASSQESFLQGGAPLMVATNAFGMGVDRPDIRRVIHYDIPRSVEAYVQETGRAGRDGEPADCTLLFDAADLHVQRFFVESGNPSRAVVTEVFRVIHSMGESRLEMTADAIAKRMHVTSTPHAVGASLAILDRAAVVRRGTRRENLAHVTVLPAAGDLFAEQPLPPGLSRLLASLVQKLGVDQPSPFDIPAFAAERGVTEETVRRGLSRLDGLSRIEYVPPFRGRATEIRRDGLPEDVLDGVDFELLEKKRANEERKLDEMVGYANGRSCRARYLLHCFGIEDAARCGRCDGCVSRKTDGVDDALRSDYAEKALRTALAAVQRFDKRYGFRKLASHLAGSRADGIAGGPLSRGETYGAFSHLGVKGSETWLRTAHETGLLRLVPHRLRSGRMVHLVGIAPAGLRVLKGEPLPSLE